MLVVLENVLSKTEVAQIRSSLESADWADGRSSAGSLSVKVKQNQQLPENSALGEELANTILRRLGSHPQFISAALPHRIYPPKFNRYGTGGHYGIHVDAAVMGLPRSDMTLRSDISATLFLSSPESYEGGELVIEGEFGAQQVKLNAGDLVLYPSSSLHQVLPVSQGVRICSFFWIQSMVRDTAERALLYDLDQSIQVLSQGVKAGDGGVSISKHLESDHALVRMTGVYHNLLRRWSQV
ncbi:Fe2+-dependent dioxygenase [Teredinibacter waterburyi]|uniref:Fe2+-dependent dioxygenase n=1 Tax=Teredinibacter waterburyi TaxID=1500538 RepID=UPI00165FA46A|nr:Fe2+-dependent dioxygenase [Teredinibacter waterburyi]